MGFILNKSYVGNENSYIANADIQQKLIAGKNTINKAFPSGMYQIKILFNNKFYLKKYLVIN